MQNKIGIIAYCKEIISFAGVYYHNTLKALLRNKLGRAGEVILCANKAKNTGIAKATARLFNAVSVQKNKSEWLSCFVTKPKYSRILKTIN
jgi:hypothetical protein